MSYVLDLDKLLPEKKEIKIDGKVFDLTIVPAEFAFETYEFIPLMEKLEKTNRLEKDEYLKLLEMYYRVLKNADDSIDYEWLKKRVNLEIFNEITPEIFSAIFSSSKKNGENADNLAKST